MAHVAVLSMSPRLGKIIMFSNTVKLRAKVRVVHCNISLTQPSSDCIAYSVPRFLLSSYTCQY